MSPDRHIEPERPPLARQIGWTLAGNVGYAACQWGMLIALAKTLPPTMVGQFGLGLAIANPVLMFTNLQLRSIQATKASQDYEFRDYLAVRLAGAALGIVVIAGIGFAIGYTPATRMVILAVALWKGLEAVADVLYGHLQQAERMNRIALSMLGRGVLSLGLLIAVVVATRDVIWAVLALGVGSFIVLLAYDLPNARRSGSRRHDPMPLKPRWSRWGATGILRLGLPLGITSLLLTVAANAPRYVLERSHGEAALGYFSALAFPSAAFTILLSALGQAATPRMAAYYESNRQAFWRLVLRMAFVPVIAGGVVAASVVALGPRFLEYIYRSDYAEYFGAFLLLLAAGAAWSLASVVGYAVTASKRLTRQAPASLVITAASVGLSLWIIPGRGVSGAGLVMVLAGLVAVFTFAILFSRRPDLPDLMERTVNLQSPVHRGAAVTWSQVEAE